MLGMPGAALFYGDGLITPAISVLSAIEGLKVAPPAFEPLVVPLACVLLGFRGPEHGTGGSAAVRAGHAAVVRLWRSGPGTRSCGPGVLAALSRSTRSRFACTAGAFVALGAVALASPAPRRSMPTWAISAAADPHGLALPWCCRRCCQLLRPGRAAAGRPRRARQPVLPSAPTWALYPLVALATAGDGHRLAGRDLRRLLDDAPGRPAGHLPRMRSSTPRNARSARSTCRRSTGCC